MKQIESIIIDYLTDIKRDATISELAHHCKINRNTVAKYLQNLNFRGDVEENTIGMSKLFRVSERIPEKGLMKLVSEPACVINSNLKIISYNQAFSALFHVKRPGIDGGLQDLFSPVFFDTSLHQPIMQAILGEPYEASHEIRIFREFYIFSIKCLPILLKDCTHGCIVIFYDVTSARILSHSLMESEERFRSLIDNHLDMVCRRAPDLTLTYVNHAYCETARSSSEDLLYTVAFPFALTHNSHETRSVYRQISPDRPEIEIETHDISSNGQARIIHWNIKGFFTPDGGVNEYLAIGRDITPLKRCEEQLRVYQQSLEYLVQERTKELQDANKKLLDELAIREKNEVLLMDRELWFRTMFNGLSDPCILFEQSKLGDPGKIIEVNDSVCRALHYSREELLTMNSSDITTEEHLLEYSKNVAQKFFENHIIRYYGIAKRKDGHTFPVEISGHRFMHKKTALVLMVCRIPGELV